MRTLTLEPNLTEARFGLRASRLTLDDSLTDCGRCMLRTANPDGALFTATPSVPKGAKSRLMIISEYACGSNSAFEAEHKELVLRGASKTTFDYIYTTSVIKCRHKKAPTKKMMECCQDRLAAELEIVKPTVIICVGKAPATIFGLSDKITKLKMGVTEVKKCPGQSSWGYSPKLIVTDPLTKIAEDVKLQNDFISAFNKAERFKDPGSGLESGIKTYAMFDNPKELDEWVTKVGNTEKDILVAADIESTGLKWFAPNARIRTIAVSWFHGYSYCIPFEENPDGYRPIVKKLFALPNLHFIFANAGFDMPYMLKTNDIYVKNFVADIFHMLYLLDPTKGAYGYNLKSAAQEHTTLGAYDTDLKTDGEDEADEEGLVNGLTIWERAPLEKLAAYNCCDTDATLRIYHYARVELIKWKMFHLVKHMANGARALMEMETNGSLINQELITTLRPRLETLVARYTTELNELAGKEVDWDSPAVLAKFLYEELKYVNPFGGDNIEDKTDETTLEFIDTDITRLILKRRRASKMLSTYINGYFHEDRVDFDGRMRGRFHLTGTRTGRLSSTDPNLQNLMKPLQKTDLAYNDMGDIDIKKAIIAPEGWFVMQADLSQAEMRIATCASKEPALSEGYREEIDIHSLNAKNAFGIKKDVTKAIEEAKALGYAEDSSEFRYHVLRYELNLIKKENPGERDAAKSVSFGILNGDFGS